MLGQGTTLTPPRRGRRARVAAIGAGLAVIVLAAAVVLVWAMAPATAGPPPAVAPAAPVGGSAPAAGAVDAAGWDVAAQAELATRPMLELPDSAAQPHELTTETAGPPLRLPDARETAGRLVPGGFAATTEGALAQLAALTEVGLSGADPDTYAQAYTAVALPGAPPASSSRLYTDLQEFRLDATLPPTGAVPDLTVRFVATNGQVKGTTDDGRYAVVCVLGELTVEYQGRTVAAGAGDCQALRFVDDEWRISPGPAAADAPLAWPGTAEAVRVGYRAVS